MINIMLKLGVLVILVTSIFSCSHIEHKIAIVPKPTFITAKKGSFNIDPETKIMLSTDVGQVREIGNYFIEILQKASNISPNVLTGLENSKKSNEILFILDPEESSLGSEGYHLTIDENLIEAVASNAAGLFYAVQTIRQLLPPAIEDSSRREAVDLSIPAVEILDKPRFSWRGMLLDCGRHFMTKDFVKRYIDLLAYYKMNRLHWHLTEDQGWRIEIKKYPKLTEIGAWRTEEDGTIYGGYYTQEDIKEVVAYAQSRYVTVVPEIEMPGHSVAALAAYPEYSCTGGPFEVSTQWGVHKDVYCAGNEETFHFLQDVLTEVMQLFPSQYIHIGGDECPKDRWQKCKKCQRRIKMEKLKDEHELQSYFIKRIEQFLLSHNRRLIGWDEILEGGLAPEATVQSWRGMDGAVAAATSGHDAIVSPTSHAYFDYDITTTNLRKVYSFEPIPADLETEDIPHILGGECNVWTERITQEKVDQMVFPRILAMSEVLWTDVENKEFVDFYHRVHRQYPRLDYLAVDYGPESIPVSIYTEFDAEKLRTKVTLDAGEPGLELYYTMDGKTPDNGSKKYKKSFLIQKPTIVQAIAYKEDMPYGDITRKEFIWHQALGKTLKLDYPYSQKYTGGGDFALTDGMQGSVNFRDGYWQGWEGDDLVAVIDFGQPITINEITMGFLQNVDSWIFLPQYVEYGVSQTGKGFDIVAHILPQVSPRDPDVKIEYFTYKTKPVVGQYLKVMAKNVGVCPDWHPGVGGKAWLFCDEIIVKE